MSAPLRLFDLPHVEARRLCRTGAPVWLTVNPVEYHGPHLSLHNDRLISQGLTVDLHARLAAATGWPMLVAGDLELGVEPCCGPGTRHARYALLREAVLEACRALRELGAERVVIMTFHGAPLHNVAIQAGVDWLRANGAQAIAPFHLLLRELLLLDDAAPYAEALAPIADERERAAMAADLRLDFHAGFFETSVAMHYAPRSVSDVHRTLPPCPALTPDAKFAAAARVARRLGRDTLARELDFAAAGVAWNALRPFPGYTGRPHLANRDSGAVFARLIVDRYAPVAEAVLDGRQAPPEPIMKWVASASFGGRLGALPRPALGDIAPAPAPAPTKA